MTINELSKEAYAEALAKGWHDQPRSDLEVFALIHSEVSEAVEEIRKGHDPRKVYWPNGAGTKPEGVSVELADVVIRIADYCGKHNIDLEWAIKAKMEFNRTRPYRHGKKL